jgi:hypothetical protein
METGFQVVANVNQIGALNQQLGARLAKTFKFPERREITSPSGHHTGTVFFERETGTGVHAWSPGRGKDKYVNLMLTGEAGASKWMQIEVQLNFPFKDYNRRMSGAFVRDASGAVFIAHRGKLTKGRAGLPKEKVFREFASRVIEAQDESLISRLILIGGLDDKDLPRRLWTFAEEAREVATRIGAELHERADADPAKNQGKSTAKKLAEAKRAAPAASTLQQLLKLRSYFDEYSGESSYTGHGGGVRTVQHGDIVRALEAYLSKRGETQKSQAIDLAVVSAEKVDLFEVKTSSRTTDVYTAVGQLVIHGGSVSDLLQKPVERFLVLPQDPSAEHAKQIKRKAGLNIITFQEKGGKYIFSGI